MDALSKSLQPFKTIVGTTAGIFTALQFLSGIFVCNDIRKKNSAAGFSITPFLGGTVLGVIGLRFAYALGDDSMIRVNFLGLAVNILYVCCFYFYTPNNNKTAVWGQIGIGGALSFAVLAYSQYEDPKLLEFRLGMLLTVCLFGLVASPYLSLGEIIKSKSTQGLPFPIILSGTIVSFLWLLYGIILNNGVMVIQNLVALALSLPILALFVIYPTKKRSSKQQKKNVKKNK